MPNFEQVVMWVAVLCAARVAWSILKYIGVACITKIHGGRAISNRYPPEWVKYHYENGGW